MRNPYRHDNVLFGSLITVMLTVFAYMRLQEGNVGEAAFIGIAAVLMLAGTLLTIWLMVRRIK